VPASASSTASANARAAIVGVSGYTGAELARLLAVHPHVRLTHVAGASSAGKRLADVLPSLEGIVDLVVQPFDAERIAKDADFALLGLPHGEAAAKATALRAAGVRVLDLSADLRLTDAAVHVVWYGEDHAGALRSEAVYGLPELFRDRIRSANVVAVPGCYPTGAILALAPLVREGLVSLDGIVVDAKSGVSGAGRSPSAAAHFPETSEGIRPYKIAGEHRHTPEIEQALSQVAGRSITLTFTPHLVPMSRGILTTAYAFSKEGALADRLREAARSFYADSPSVAILPPGRLPDTLWVRGSNRAHLQYAVDTRTGRAIALSAIDNLGKGAAGQAIQCLNLMAGLPEGDGLGAPAVFP